MDMAGESGEKGGRKRKRTMSPQGVDPDANPAESPPAKKASRMESLLSFFSPRGKQAASGEAPKSGQKSGQKKRISFGTPVVHKFDTQSPARRRRPEADDADIDAEKQDMESLRVELRCRKEEEELTNFDIEKANHKAMAKMVNALWTKDQMAKLKLHGVAVESDKKLPRKEIAHRVSLMEAIERKSDVLMSGEHSMLPDQMDMDDLYKELKIRRIATEGERATLEQRLEDALLKEGSRFDVKGEDGYAFGRHAVSARNVIEELSVQELRHQLLLPHWGLDKKKIPRKREDREALLEKLVNEELDVRKRVAFDLAMDNMLSCQGLEMKGPKRERFVRLADHLMKQKSGKRLLV